LDRAARVRLRLGVLVVLATGAALLGAACGSSSSPALAGQTAYQEALAYAQCMRVHGEPQFPDPNSQGNFLLPASTGGTPNSAAFVSANKACQHLLPKTRPMTAAQQRRVTAQALKFVACMRSHGLPNMPDPIVNANGIGLRIGGGPGSTGPRPSMQVVQAAQRACQKLMPGAPP
jgi:hypothetical protein